MQLLAEMRVADAVAELSVDTDVPDDAAPAMPAVEAEAAVAVPSSASHMFKPSALQLGERNGSPKGSLHDNVNELFAPNTSANKYCQRTILSLGSDFDAQEGGEDICI